MTKSRLRKLCCLALMSCGAWQSASAQTFNELLAFNYPNGKFPLDVALVQGSDGNLYGTTYRGGVYDDGSVFKVTPGGILTTLYSFCSQGFPSCTDGQGPYAGLILSTDGSFYGTTYSGGLYDYGTVFKITPEGSLATLHSFCSQFPQCSDGYLPVAPLLQATDGNFYGTASQGGSGGAGTIFRITPKGTLTTLFSFGGYGISAPRAGLIQGTDGNFYGTTPDPGSVFSLTMGGKFTTLYQFCSKPNCTDGDSPVAPVMQAVNGNFYGTTSSGGANNCGTVFELTPQGHLTVVYSFCSEPNGGDGEQPASGVVQGTDGNLYGTTGTGGTGANCYFPAGCGTAFMIERNGTLTTLHDFDGNDGSGVIGTLSQGTNGEFYGTTETGGDISNCNNPLGCGVVYSLDMSLGPFVSFVRAAGKIGQAGGILGQGFTGTSAVSLNGIPANFTVVSDTFMKATVPPGATTGYVTVTTPTGVLTSNVPFHVLPQQ